MTNFAGNAALVLVRAVPVNVALAVDEHFISDSAVIDVCDVVTYHTEGMPMKGSADHRSTCQGAKWQSPGTISRHCYLYKMMATLLTTPVASIPHLVGLEPLGAHF